MGRGRGRKKGEKEECARMGMRAECSNTSLTFTAFQFSQGKDYFL